MSKDMAMEPTAEEAANIEEAVNRLVAEIKRANEKMESDQREIERLKARTRATLSRLKAAWDVEANLRSVEAVSPHSRNRQSITVSRLKNCVRSWTI